MPSFAPRHQHSFPLPPIPGTEQPHRALFIDRWGTLLAPTECGPNGPSLEFTPGAVDALFRATQAGWNLYLIGNEDAVARGQVSDAAWSEFENSLLAHLHAHGARIVRNYACLEHPLGKGPHKKNSVFRLPDTGTFYHAAQNDGVVLGESWVIGDSTLELVAGTRAGCRSIAVQSGLALGDGALDVEPHCERENLSSAVDLFLRAEAYARP
jgi:histidinol phosphatase-like enzyme